uniref:(northern house mosquito) hypothetical protein n=1 Tax=Culex pipiens TaxID=7175 RepID=A0A8D8EX51_CULPI
MSYTKNWSTSPHRNQATHGQTTRRTSCSCRCLEDRAPTTTVASNKQVWRNKSGYFIVIYLVSVSSFENLHFLLLPVDAFVRLNERHHFATHQTAEKLSDRDGSFGRGGAFTVPRHSGPPKRPSAGVRPRRNVDYRNVLLGVRSDVVNLQTIHVGVLSACPPDQPVERKA